MCRVVRFHEVFTSSFNDDFPIRTQLGNNNEQRIVPAVGKVRHCSHPKITTTRFGNGRRTQCNRRAKPMKFSKQKFDDPTLFIIRGRERLCLPILSSLCAFDDPHHYKTTNQENPSSLKSQSFSNSRKEEHPRQRIVSKSAVPLMSRTTISVFKTGNIRGLPLEAYLKPPGALQSMLASTHKPNLLPINLHPLGRIPQPHLPHILKRHRQFQRLRQTSPFGNVAKRVLNQDSIQSHLQSIDRINVLAECFQGASIVEGVGQGADGLETPEIGGVGDGEGLDGETGGEALVGVVAADV